MLGWALIINNLGRRRYPLHWWSPESVFVRTPQDIKEAAQRSLEEGEEEAREDLEEGEFVGETLRPEDLRRESQLENEARRSSEHGSERGSLHSATRTRTFDRRSR